MHSIVNTDCIINILVSRHLERASNFFNFEDDFVVKFKCNCFHETKINTNLLTVIIDLVVYCQLTENLIRRLFIAHISTYF